MSLVIDIADALTTLLNSHAFSEEFEAAREYRPLVDLVEMKDLRVTVVPKGLATVPIDRSRVQQDVEVNVVVQQKLEAGDAEELDGLMSLVEEIGAFLKFKRLESVGASWVKTTNDPIFAPDHLEQLRQFTSVLTVTYRVVR